MSGEETKQDTARHLKASLLDTLANPIPNILYVSPGGGSKTALSFFLAKNVRYVLV